MATWQGIVLKLADFGELLEAHQQTIMDPSSFEQKPNAPRKVKYKPKAPIRKTSKLAVPKTEIFDDAETAAEAKDLMQRLQDSLATKPKIEKKVEPVQRVAFGYGLSIPNNQFSASHKSNSGYQDKLRFSTKREVKEYKEPWNYYSYYPVTLPLRRPFSGNPDILDNEEFGQVYTFDESMSNPAMGLGLIMEENSEPKMMFFQLPMNMPMTKQPSSSNTIEKPAGLEDLQAGIMGKMLVYGSGAVKLKLGDTFYDVGHGSDCVFAQDVVAFNAADKHCSAVGELIKRAIVTPDVNSILEDFADVNL